MPVRPRRPVHALGASWLLPLLGADRMPFFLRGKTAAAGRRSARGMTARSRAGGSREGGRERHLPPRLISYLATAAA